MLILPLHVREESLLMLTRVVLTIVCFWVFLGVVDHLSNQLVFVTFHNSVLVNFSFVFALP